MNKSNFFNFHYFDCSYLKLLDVNELISPIVVYEILYLLMQKLLINVFHIMSKVILNETHFF